MTIKKKNDDWFILILILFILIVGVGAIMITQVGITQERASAGGQSMNSTSYHISARASSGANNSTSSTNYQLNTNSP